MRRMRNYISNLRKKLFKLKDKSQDSLSEEDLKLEEFAFKVAALFERLVLDTWSTSSQEVLYAVVRVSGMSGPGWDPFDESLRAFSDYNVLLKAAEKEGDKTRHMRLKLLYYCHLVEVSAPLDLIYNLLRIKSGQKYHIKPFHNLYKTRKNRTHKIPPVVNEKIRELHRMASDEGDKELIDLFKTIYNDEIRNSFFHSDYCLTNAQYRWTESGPANSMNLDRLDFLIESAIAYYKAIFHIWDQARYQLGSNKKYWQMHNYETLELLRNPKGMLTGFSMHFSNGTKATYNRNIDTSIDAVNITFEIDGNINFFIGSFDELKREWQINGTKVKEWDNSTLYNQTP